MEFMYFDPLHFPFLMYLCIHMPVHVCVLKCVYIPVQALVLKNTVQLELSIRTFYAGKNVLYLYCSIYKPLGICGY